jgi:hypothetical protein
MKKFKLTNNDVSSLENATSLMNNAVLKNASFEVLSTSSTGGNAFAKAGPITFGKVIH